MSNRKRLVKISDTRALEKVELKKETTESWDAEYKWHTNAL